MTYDKSCTRTKYNVARPCKTHLYNTRCQRTVSCIYTQYIMELTKNIQVGGLSRPFLTQTRMPAQTTPAMHWHWIVSTKTILIGVTVKLLGSTIGTWTSNGLSKAAINFPWLSTTVSWELRPCQNQSLVFSLQSFSCFWMALEEDECLRTKRYANYITKNLQNGLTLAFPLGLCWASRRRNTCWSWVKLSETAYAAMQRRGLMWSI